MNIVTDVVLPIALAFIMFSLGLGLSISDFTRIFLKPKDKIAYLSPSYAMYIVYSKIFNLNLISIPYDKNFKLDKAKLIKTIKSGIKVLFIPNPNQPIEDNLSLKDFKTLAKICKK